MRNPFSLNRLAPLALLVASSTIGCVDNAASGTESTTATESALEQENGGFDTADELPQFGEQDLYQTAAIENDTGVTDAMSSDPSVTTIESAPNVERHRLLILWGQLPPDRDATARNWSGSLTLSRGALVVGRTIGFEDATDHLLPRTAPATVDFQSVTKPFVDGLALRVLDPDPSQGALHLTYQSAADASIAYDLDLSQLASGPISIDAGGGARVIAVAVRDNDACDHGFMRGRWRALREGLGVYRGVVANSDGQVAGHIRGIWGVRRDGTHVMFGKFIDTDGHFRGILAGRYDAGHWQARWIVQSGDHGVAGGVYFDAPNLPGGVFLGRWAETSCAM